MQRNEQKVSKNFLSSDLQATTASRFNCHSAVRIPNNIKKCLWIQEAASEIWIDLVQNIIHNAQNEQRNRLDACIHKWADIWNIFFYSRLLQKQAKFINC